MVHDPTARYMGGVAGHAGLFTTAMDLSKFAQMMLNGGAPIVSAATVKKFTEPQTPLHQHVMRGLGWDIDSPFSSNRGELFPVGSYGHTGFTGTSLWIDPRSQTYVILLTNSVHPTPPSADHRTPRQSRHHRSRQSRNRRAVGVPHRFRRNQRLAAPLAEPSMSSPDSTSCASSTSPRSPVSASA